MTDDYDVMWGCPYCGYVMSDILYRSIIIDADCPGCWMRKCSQFKCLPAPFTPKERW
jgi:hypothetical protein